MSFIQSLLAIPSLDMVTPRSSTDISSTCYPSRTLTLRKRLVKTKRTAYISSLIGIIIFEIVSAPVYAKAPLTQRTVSFFVADAHDNRAGLEAISSAQMITVPNAKWLRVIFESASLTEGGLIIIEGQEGVTQRLDANALRAWGNTSAYFNGSALKVTLSLPKGAYGSYRVRNILADAPLLNKAKAQSLKHKSEQVGIPIGIDERAYVLDGRVGRVMPVGCTGWITSTGVGMSAGHCAGADFQIIQFNVPPSLPNGTPQYPPPSDQFAITNVVDSNSAGSTTAGNDWLLFKMEARFYTGDRSFFRLIPPPTIPASPAVQNGQITGYGTFPYGGPYNARSQTEQTNAAPYLGLCMPSSKNSALQYLIDTAGGNSGSPVFLPGTSLAFGIHTAGFSGADGGCLNPPFNIGTPSTNVNLLNTLTKFIGGGNRVLYVDFASPAQTTTGSGTVLDPYRDLAIALSQVVPNQTTTLSFAPGSYTPNGVTIMPPSGSTIIIQPSIGDIRIGSPPPN